MHEVGHALGFIHEHERKDRTCDMWCKDCTPPGYHPKNDAALLTPFDSKSVMHYVDDNLAGTILDGGVPYSPCTDPPGTSDYSGLTEYDMLGAEITYPRENSNMILGAGIVRNDIPVRLIPEHVNRGALTGPTTGSLSGSVYAYPEFSWYRTDNWQVFATSAQVTQTVTTLGTYNYWVFYKDAWGRASSRSATVRVASPAEHTGIMTSASVALL